MPQMTPVRRRSVLMAVLITALGGLVSLPAPGEAGTRRMPASPTKSLAVRQSDDGYNRDVRIHNQTGWTMTDLYASGSGDWGDDLLGDGALTPGDSVVVTLDDGSGACRYALRAGFDNGQSLRRDDINACQVADYYFTR